MDESVGTKASPCFRNRCWNAQGGIRATRFQRRSYKRCDREAWQSIRLASLGTERLWTSSELMDTSWLFEPTTGVHQFGGGSACLKRADSVAEVESCIGPNFW